MGTDKALLRLGGSTLLEIALRKVADVCGEAAILCGSAERAALLASYGRCIVDRIPGCGPLGGLDAALHDAGSDRVLVAPVDVPLLPAALLKQLVSCHDPVACFEADGFVQPLPVMFSADVFSDVAQAFEAGERKLIPLFRRLGLCPIVVDDTGVFANLNTPEEFTAAEHSLRG